MEPTRDDAWALLTAHTASPSLRKHGLAVEAAMRGYARRLGADEDRWGIVGLIHDFDYDEHPSLEEHPFVGTEILRQHGWPEDIIHAVLAHADHTGAPRRSPMDRTLYAVDELTGFIVAVALIRPSRTITDLPAKSITKKFRDKAFCRAIDRDHLRAAAAELDIELRTHVENVLESLQGIADELELG